MPQDHPSAVASKPDVALEDIKPYLFQVAPDGDYARFNQWLIGQKSHHPNTDFSLVPVQTPFFPQGGQKAFLDAFCMAFKSMRTTFIPVDVSTDPQHPHVVGILIKQRSRPMPGLELKEYPPEIILINPEGNGTDEDILLEIDTSFSFVAWALRHEHWFTHLAPIASLIKLACKKLTPFRGKFMLAEEEADLQSSRHLPLPRTLRFIQQVQPLQKEDKPLAALLLPSLLWQVLEGSQGRVSSAQLREVAAIYQRWPIKAAPSASQETEVAAVASVAAAASSEAATTSATVAPLLPTASTAPLISKKVAAGLDYTQRCLFHLGIEQGSASLVDLCLSQKVVRETQLKLYDQAVNKQEVASPTTSPLTWPEREKIRCTAERVQPHEAFAFAAAETGESKLLAFLLQEHGERSALLDTLSNRTYLLSTLRSLNQYLDELAIRIEVLKASRYLLEQAPKTLISTFKQHVEASIAQFAAHYQPLNGPLVAAQAATSFRAQLEAEAQLIYQLAGRYSEIHHLAQYHPVYLALYEAFFVDIEQESCFRSTQERAGLLVRLGKAEEADQTLARLEALLTRLQERGFFREISPLQAKVIALLMPLNIDLQDCFGDSLLHAATRQCQAGVVELLLTRGASGVLKNKCDETPLQLLLIVPEDNPGRRACLEVIGKQWKLNTQPSSRPLLECEGAASAAQSLMLVRDTNNNTLMHYALFRGDVPLVRRLLMSGNDVALSLMHAANAQGQTPWRLYLDNPSLNRDPFLLTSFYNLSLVARATGTAPSSLHSDNFFESVHNALLKKREVFKQDQAKLEARLLQQKMTATQREGAENVLELRTPVGDREFRRLAEDSQDFQFLCIAHTKAIGDAVRVVNTDSRCDARMELAWEIYQRAIRCHLSVMGRNTLFGVTWSGPKQGSLMRYAIDQIQKARKQEAEGKTPQLVETQHKNAEEARSLSDHLVKTETEARLEAAEREIAALKAALAAQGVPLPPTTHRGADPRFYARPAASTSHEETPVPAPTSPSSSRRGQQ